MSFVINPYRFGGGAPPAAYIVDDYSPEGAWSLREIASAYVGVDIVKLRRASDSVTQDFTAAEITDGTTLSTFASGSDVLVDTMYDQTGGGNDLTQTAQATMPKIYDGTTGLITEGGNPAMEFTGSDEQHLLTSATNSWLAGSDFSVFWVGNHHLPASLRVIWATDASLQSTGQQRAMYNQATNQLLLAFSGSNTGTSLSTWTDNVQTLMTTIATGMLTGESHTVDTWVDGGGNSQWTGTGKLTPNNGKFIVGRASSTSTATTEFDGRLQECIVFASDKSADRTGIDGNITTYYGI